MYWLPLKESFAGKKIDALWQLDSNLHWEVVFSDLATKQRLLAWPKRPVGDYDATLEPLFHTTRRLRLTRIQMCIPNEFVVSLLTQHRVKVVDIKFEVDRVDHSRTGGVLGAVPSAAV